MKKSWYVQEIKEHFQQQSGKINIPLYVCILAREFEVTSLVIGSLSLLLNYHLILSKDYWHGCKLRNEIGKLFL